MNIPEVGWVIVVMVVNITLSNLFGRFQKRKAMGMWVGNKRLLSTYFSL